MSDIFFESGKIREKSFKICDESDCKGSIKIADLVAGFNKKSAKIVGSLAIAPTKGPQKMDVQDAELFAFLWPTPDPGMRDRKQRDVLFVVGQSGSGKSTFSSRYAESFQKTKSLSGNGKMPRIIMFSAVPEDPEFDDRLVMKRISFDKLVDENGEPSDVIQIEDLQDSLVIFDDIDVMENKKLQKWVTALRDRCLQIGRHYNISMICVGHEIFGYRATRILHQEATKVVLFPETTPEDTRRRYYKTYGGLDKEQIKKVLDIKTQWVLLHRSYPRYICHANAAYFVDE